MEKWLFLKFGDNKPKIIEDPDEPERVTESFTPDEAFWILRNRVCFGYDVEKKFDIPENAEAGYFFLLQSMTAHKNLVALLARDFDFDAESMSKEEMQDEELIPDGIRSHILLINI